MIKFLLRVFLFFCTLTRNAYGHEGVQEEWVHNNFCMVLDKNKNSNSKAQTQTKVHTTNVSS